eukprot:363042-Chlamydomonas_euryale.AAC.8
MDTWEPQRRRRGADCAARWWPCCATAAAVSVVKLAAIVGEEHGRPRARAGKGGGRCGRLGGGQLSTRTPRHLRPARETASIFGFGSRRKLKKGVTGCGLVRTSGQSTSQARQREATWRRSWHEASLSLSLSLPGGRVLVLPQDRRAAQRSSRCSFGQGCVASQPWPKLQRQGRRRRLEEPSAASTAPQPPLLVCAHS